MVAEKTDGLARGRLLGQGIADQCYATLRRREAIIAANPNAVRARVPGSGTAVWEKRWLKRDIPAESP